MQDVYHTIWPFDIFQSAISIILLPSDFKTISMKISFCISFLLISVLGFCQSNLTAKDILNKELIYSFTGGNILIIISSDTTLFWKDDSKPKEAHEKTKTIHVNDHLLMTSWYEADRTFVTLLSDFEKLKVSGMVCRVDGKFYPIEGTIKLRIQ